MNLIPPLPYHPGTLQKYLKTFLIVTVSRVLPAPSGLERPVGQACAGQGPFKKNYLVQNIHRAKAEKPCCIWRISSFLVFPDGFFSVGKLLESLSLLQLGTHIHTHTHTHMHTQFFSGSLESKLQTQCLINPRYFCIYFLVLFFWPCRMTCGILVP